MTELDDIKGQLAERAETLARELLPTGWRSGHYWMAACPWRQDRNAGSFWVNLAGAKRPGTWRDAASGETGGPLDLVMKTNGLDFKAALDWSRAFLGLGGAGLSDDERRRRAEERTRRQQSADADYERGIAEARAKAQKLFGAAKMRPFLGSPADIYLRHARGIDVRDLGRLPGCLGWLPDQRHPESGRTVPALVASITEPGTGRFLGVHRTFLEPDGSDKLAPPPGWAKGRRFPARKVWPGGIAGGVIKLWRGESGMREREAVRHGVLDELALCEGVEDGLSLAVSLPALRIWGAYALGNLAQVVVPVCSDRVVLFADNDWGKPQALAQFDAAVAALQAQGRPVRVARSHIGKDVNDALLGGRVRHACGEPAGRDGRGTA